MSQIKISQIWKHSFPQFIHQEYPIAFIAGAAQTGTDFFESGDGHSGFASFFLDRDYIDYLSE
jgi:hypothetical protein